MNKLRRCVFPDPIVLLIPRTLMSDSDQLQRLTLVNAVIPIQPGMASLSRSHPPRSAAGDRFASMFLVRRGQISGRSVRTTSPPSRQKAMPASPGPAPSSMPCFPFTAAREKSPFRECCRQNRSLLKVLYDTEDQSKVVFKELRWSERSY